MKKYFIIVIIIIALYITFDIVYYRLGWYIDFNKNAPITVVAKTSGKSILINTGDNFVPFEIKGVDIGASIPGEYSTSYNIPEATYFRWFQEIQDMGANTIRLDTVFNSNFYKAFYKFNKDNSNPLYLIQGIAVDNYIQFSYRDAYNNQFYGALLSDAKSMVDVVHGRKEIISSKVMGSGSFKKDISKWVIGYILGTEWEPTTIAYTNNTKSNLNIYDGKYIQTGDAANSYEAMLARVGDQVIQYETQKYKSQRLISFINSPTTDPFDYPADIKNYLKKIVNLDIEHWKPTNELLSGVFASYNVYSYAPNYFNCYDYIGINSQEDENQDSYYKYLKSLTDYHSVPVLITGFGYSTSRGVAGLINGASDTPIGMNEEEQGQKIIQDYNDIKHANCAGAIIETWQDEWNQTTWNTKETTDTSRTPFWSNYQTSSQSYGLLAFDPGTTQSVSYVDGDISEWNKKDIVTSNEDMTLSMKYDEKFIYFMVEKNENIDDNKPIYIPIDTTQKSGSKNVDNLNVNFSRDADFLIIINGSENSEILVQERYDYLRGIGVNNIKSENLYEDIPDKNSSKFNPIKLMLRERLVIGSTYIPTKFYETGKLKFGIANPSSENFDSLADFYINGNTVEIRLPWQLLNFSDPSTMQIHDDYYKNYGVVNMTINKMYVGVGTAGTIPMDEFKLKPWGNKVTFHERLKQSYYEIQSAWRK